LPHRLNFVIPAQASLVIPAEAGIQGLCRSVVALTVGCLAFGECFAPLPRGELLLLCVPNPLKGDLEKK